MVQFNPYVYISYWKTGLCFWGPFKGLHSGHLNSGVDGQNLCVYNGHGVHQNKIKKAKHVLLPFL